MSGQPGNLKVTSINDNTVLLQVPGQSGNRRLEHDTFTGEDGAGEAAENFYIASVKDAVVGVASDTLEDRAVVAALVGNWIASGYVVTNVNRKELLRKLRIVTPAKKDEVIDTANTGADTPAAAAETPTENAPAAEPHEQGGQAAQATPESAAPVKKF